MPATQILREQILALAGSAELPRYVALYSDAECTQELDVPGYARVLCSDWVTSWDGLTRSNSAPVTWAPWPQGGVFRGLAVTDAAMGGSKLWAEPVTNALDEPSVAVPAGDFPELAPGALEINWGG